MGYDSRKDLDNRIDNHEEAVEVEGYYNYNSWDKHLLVVATVVGAVVVVNHIAHRAVVVVVALVEEDTGNNYLDLGALQ